MMWGALLKVLALLGVNDGAFWKCSSELLCSWKLGILLWYGHVTHNSSTTWSSWLPTFAFQSPIMKRISFLGVSSKSLVGLHRTIQLQLLQHYWLEHRLGLLWYWMDCLGNEQRSFCNFWDCIQVLHFGLFCWLWMATPFLLGDSCPQ